jgi:hypothetical protein
MLHDYHFVLNEKAYLKLIETAEMLGKSLSNTIVVLFENLSACVEENHFEAREKNSRYKIISDPDEKRFHVHSYIPEKMYRKIKQLHHDLNYFSLAQVLRELIDKFLAGCLKYGVKKFINLLENIQNIWEKKKEYYKKMKINITRQLSYENNIFPYILITYDCNSRPWNMQFI